MGLDIMMCRGLWLVILIFMDVSIATDSVHTDVINSYKKLQMFLRDNGFSDYERAKLANTFSKIIQTNDNINNEEADNYINDSTKIYEMYGTETVVTREIVDSALLQLNPTATVEDGDEESVETEVDERLENSEDDSQISEEKNNIVDNATLKLDGTDGANTDDEGEEEKDDIMDPVPEIEDDYSENIYYLSNDNAANNDDYTLDDQDDMQADNSNVNPQNTVHHNNNQQAKQKNSSNNQPFQWPFSRHHISPAPQNYNVNESPQGSNVPDDNDDYNDDYYSPQKSNIRHLRRQHMQEGGDDNNEQFDDDGDDDYNRPNTPRQPNRSNRAINRNNYNNPEGYFDEDTEEATDDTPDEMNDDFDDKYDNNRNIHNNSRRKLNRNNSNKQRPLEVENSNENGDNSVDYGDDNNQNTYDSSTETPNNSSRTAIMAGDNNQFSDNKQAYKMNSHSGDDIVDSGGSEGSLENHSAHNIQQTTPSHAEAVVKDKPIKAASKKAAKAKTKRATKQQPQCCYPCCCPCPYSYPAYVYPCDYMYSPYINPCSYYGTSSNLQKVDDLWIVS